jgi:hypothetical protein
MMKFIQDWGVFVTLIVGAIQLAVFVRKALRPRPHLKKNKAFSLFGLVLISVGNIGISVLLSMLMACVGLLVYGSHYEKSFAFGGMALILLAYQYFFFDRIASEEREDYKKLKELLKRRKNYKDLIYC